MKRKSIGYVAVELGKRMAPDYFKTGDGSWINPTVLLDEKVRRAGLAASFADLRTNMPVWKKDQPFVPRTTFAVPNSTKCQIWVPQFRNAGADALPVWKAKRDQPTTEYPYYYLTYNPAIHRRNTSQNNALLNEIRPENEALLNPQLASKLGRAGRWCELRRAQAPSNRRPS